MWAGTIGALVLMLINGFQVFLPGQWSVGDFLTAYIGIPVFMVICLGHRSYFSQDAWFKEADEIDMTGGLDEVLAAERPTPARGRVSRVSTP